MAAPQETEHLLRESTVSEIEEENQLPKESSSDGSHKSYRDSLLQQSQNLETVHLSNGVSKKVLDVGSGEEQPKANFTCFVHYRAWAEPDLWKIEDTFLENGPVEIMIGHEKNHLRGLSIALKSMATGERALITVPSELAFGEQGSFSFPAVPPNTQIVFECKLLGFQPPTQERPRSEMTVEERIAAADRRRVDGNELFKLGNVSDALQQYEMALGYMGEEFMMQMFGKYIDLANSVRVPVILNIAQCCIKLGTYERAIQYCDMVIAEDSGNAKALYRRGKARSLLGQSDSATEDLLKASKIAPLDKGIISELQKLKKGEREQREKQREMYSGMFQKPKAQKRSWVEYFKHLLSLLGNLLRVFLLRKQHHD